MTYVSNEFQITPLDNHDRAAFCCGVEPLDRYFKQQASQDQRKGVAAVFVLANNSGKVAGYYTLCNSSIDGSDLPPLPSRLRPPRYPQLPATLIGRLAVDQSFRGRRFGQALLIDALKRAWKASFEVASLAMIVDAKDEDASNFYAHFGFSPFPRTPYRLFLLMRTLEDTFKKEP